MQTFIVIVHIYFLVEIWLTKGHLSLIFENCALNYVQG